MERILKFIGISHYVKHTYRDPIIKRHKVFFVRFFCPKPFFINSCSFHTGSEENPTLLHFAARFGLEKLAWQLLECPGGDVACDMRNTNDMTPADLAEQAGHVRLAHQLRGYMVRIRKTICVVNVYSWILMKNF